MEQPALLGWPSACPLGSHIATRVNAQVVRSQELVLWREKVVVCFIPGSWMVASRKIQLCPYP